MRRSLVLCALAAATLSILSAGCGGGADSKLSEQDRQTFTHPSATPPPQAMQATAAAQNAAHPNQH